MAKKKKKKKIKSLRLMQVVMSALSAGMLVWVVMMYVQIGSNITHNYDNLHQQGLHGHGSIGRLEDDALKRRLQEAIGHVHKDSLIPGADLIKPIQQMSDYNIPVHNGPYTISPLMNWEAIDRLHLAPEERTVAIGLGITTRGLQDIRADRVPTELPFFTRLLASFCATCSYGFGYHIYMAHDFNDPYFHFNDSHNMFQEHFKGFIQRNCPRNINVTLHLIDCDHTGNPAWAQNDAMMHAYMDNIAYYYRVNDDTVLESAGWTEKLIEQLLKYNPPNVGVAGPWFRDGNIAILTHDFVHRTHVDIFGFYYPRVFTDWFADDWITGVYWPERARKVPGTRIKHTMEMGNRYVVHFEKANRVNVEVEVGRLILNRYIKGIIQGKPAAWSMTDKNVVVMSLYGEDPAMMYGIMRYAQLIPVIMPGWRMRVYVEDTTRGEIYTVHKPLNKFMLRKFENIGIEIIRLDNVTAAELPPDMWSLLVADDSSVERFIIRKATMRPTEREAAALDLWIKSKRSFHCIRDHPSHANRALTVGLIGGMPSLLKKILGKSIRSLLRGYTSTEQFLNDGLWPLIRQHSLCHDSVSCKDWRPNVDPYPVLREENEYVGQPHDEDDVASEVSESRFWNSMYTSPDCVYIRDTGFKETALRTVIRARPVFWSQDYHVMPVMDIKSLLKPVGVKVIDKSLSYYCGQVGTCATGLRIITRDNGMRLTPEIIHQFYESYKDDPEMNQVTAFVCTLPVAMCEAFMPFNRSIIVIANIRYEQGRPEVDKWTTLNENLIKIARHPRGVIAANNRYDQKYIEYFTGIKPVLVPNACYYLQDSYKPTRKHFLVTPIHSTELSEHFYMKFDEALMKHQLDLQVMPLRQMYPQYLFSDLAAHPGIIYIPYQVSMASLSEQYRMNIPMFFPTRELLTNWHLEYQIVRHRTWAGYLRKTGTGSPIKGVLPDVPDPNIDIDHDAVFYWLQYADFYQWPNLIYFSSMDELVHKMMHTNLTEVSLRMQAHNLKVRQEIKNTWSDILLKITPGVT